MNSTRFLLPLLALLISTSFLHAETTGAMEGRVTDTAGHPVAGIIIAVGTTRQTQTKADGTFSILRIPSGQQPLRITHPSYQIAIVNDTLEILSGKTIALEVTLTHSPPSLPVADYRIAHSSPAVSVRPDLPRKEMGKNLSHLPTTKKEETPISIQGKVIDKDSIGIPGVRIEVIGTNRGALTKPGGTFVMRGLQPGSYTLQISILGKEGVKMEVMVRTDTIASLEAQLLDDDGSFGCVGIVCFGPLPQVDPLTTGTHTILSREDVLWR